MLSINSESSHKLFNHKFIDKIELTENYQTGQRRYQLPDGSLVPSVTTVLSSLDKGHLDVWRKRVGEVEADKITNQAKNRGTAIHKLAEDYLMNKEDYHVGAMPINLYDFKNHLKPYLDGRVDNILGIEYPLFSKRLKTAGRTDLIADWDGSPAIIDFKTSRKPKKEEWITNYKMQAAFYAAALYEMTGIEVKQSVILISVDNDEPQVFVQNVYTWISEFIKVRNQYKNLYGM